MSAVLEPTAAAVSAPGFVVRAPYCEVHIPTRDAGEHIEMRAKQMAAILRVMPIANYSAPMVRLVGQMANSLVEAIQGGDDAALLATQLAEILLMIQGVDGPCDLLWLCQQIASEIDETVSDMIRERGTS
jgi:hypothetical protein